MRVYMRNLLLGLTILCLTGCNLRLAQGEKRRHDQELLVGFAMDTLKEERWQRDRDYFTARLRALGVRVIVQHANNDTSLQLQQIDDLIRRHVDVLVIVPHEAEKMANAVAKARKAGIRVVSYDRLMRNVPMDLYISFDNVKVGELMAEYLVKRLPSGRYVIINGAPTDNNCSMFNKGYKNVLNSPKGKDVQVISEIWADDWRPEAAYQHIESLLRKGESFDAVIAANDSLASAVIQSLAERRLAGKVLVAGHDADLSGCQRIVEGTQAMTIYKPIRTLADRAAELVYLLAQGKNLQVKNLIFNGKYYVPAEIIDPISIDPSNMTTIVNDGFHRLEDIYMNVPASKWPKL